MTMTLAEQLVWAAAFVEAYEKDEDGRIISRRDDRLLMYVQIAANVVMDMRRQIEILREILIFSAKSEFFAIEKMIRNRGGYVTVDHCKCGDIADPTTKELYECRTCYERGYGK